MDTGDTLGIHRSVARIEVTEFNTYADGKGPPGHGSTGSWLERGVPIMIETVEDKVISGTSIKVHGSMTNTERLGAYALFLNRPQPTGRNFFLNMVPAVMAEHTFDETDRKPASARRSHHRVSSIGAGATPLPIAVTVAGIELVRSPNGHACDIVPGDAVYYDFHARRLCTDAWYVDGGFTPGTNAHAWFQTYREHLGFTYIGRACVGAAAGSQLVECHVDTLPFHDL